MQQQVNPLPLVDANSLRSAQRVAITNMLHLNSTDESSSSVGPDNVIWKVLIFDKFGQDVISSIMRVNDLRENGVTATQPRQIIFA
ncbi:hypothetical protein G6F68_016542 [Rhizopus microsporus]|nr:hypothetical protein G6F68_016542 [Rhizopus microsporus]